MTDRRNLPVWQAVVMNRGMGEFAEVCDSENRGEGQDNPCGPVTTLESAIADAVAFDNGPRYMQNPRPLWAAFCERFAGG